jgi:hypothetical protein
MKDMIGVFVGLNPLSEKPHPKTGDLLNRPFEQTHWLIDKISSSVYRSPYQLDPSSKRIYFYAFPHDSGTFSGRCVSFPNAFCQDFSRPFFIPISESLFPGPSSGCPFLERGGNAGGGFRKPLG